MRKDHVVRLLSRQAWDNTSESRKDCTQSRASNGGSNQWTIEEGKKSRTTFMKHVWAIL